MSDNKYTFISRDSNSSVYKALASYLLNHRKGEWRKAKSDSLRFNLMLGDRNKLPFTRLGQIPDLHQLVNYYRGSEVICRKCSFVRELKKYRLNKGVNMFSWFPDSYIILPSHLRNQNNHLPLLIESQNDQKKDERVDLLKACKTWSSPDSIWIAKSSSGSKGDGIMLSSDVEDLIKKIDSQQQAYIIQKYINNPFLLDKQRKFDIRCWVLIGTDCSIYLFKEGVIRTSSENYKLDDLNDLASHLTNHNLQKQTSSNFGLYEEGNEMFYEQFNEYLMNCTGESLEISILPQIKDIIVNCFKIISDSLDTTSLNYRSFQLFGFDFLLDASFKVWLLEINGAPACAQKLLPTLIESLVTTVIDPAFPSSNPAACHSGSSQFEKLVS